MGKQILFFLVLAFTLSWAPWFRSLATETAFSGLFSFGPMIAAFVVAAWGWPQGPLVLLKRLFRWRVPAVWYGVALLLPVAALAVVCAAHLALGGSAPSATALAGWPAAAAGFPLILVFGGPLGEELGWRGYLQPLLMSKGRSALSAALMVGIVWALWHLPLFVAGSMPAPAAIVIFLGGITYAWLYLNAGQSAWIATLHHAVVNTFGGQFFFELFPQSELTQVILLRVLVEGGIAIGLAVWLGRDLGAGKQANER